MAASNEGTYLGWYIYPEELFFEKSEKIDNKPLGIVTLADILEGSESHLEKILGDFIIAFFNQDSSLREQARKRISDLTPNKNFETFFEKIDDTNYRIWWTYSSLPYWQEVAVVSQESEGILGDAKRRIAPYNGDFQVPKL